MTNSELYLREVILRRDQVPDFSRYPFALAALASLERQAFRHPVTFFIGENGSGKSTLLEAIAVALGFNAEGGSRNFRRRFCSRTPKPRSMTSDRAGLDRSATRRPSTFVSRVTS